jgi:hypothetical protein
MKTMHQYKYISQAAEHKCRLACNNVDASKFDVIEADYLIALEGSNSDRDDLLEKLYCMNQWFEDQIPEYLLGVPDDWLVSSDLIIKQGL